MAKKDSSGGFKYRPRTEAEVKARASVSSNREGFCVEGVKTFSPKAGSHTIRILPPTWKDAKHYGFDAYAHYNIGPDGSAYLCLKKHKNEECPICEERARAVREDDEELAEALKWKRRVACWIIDRDNEKDGPLLWFMPQSVDVDISKISVVKKTGEVLNLDDPEEGYDISFDREGERRNTKYVGLVVERRSSPLSDDAEEMEEWLEYVKENKIPDQLLFQDQEYIEGIIGDGLTVPKDARDKAKGGGKPKLKGKQRDEDEEDEDKPRRSKRKEDDEDEDEKPSRRARKDADEDEDDDKPKKKARAAADDEDEDEDDDKPKKKKKAVEDDEDEEEDKPAKKKKKAADDDEDEDEDEDDDKPARKGKARKTDDDDDEEDNPRKKKKASDDDEEDEDEDDDKPARKKKKADDDDDEEKPSMRSRLSEMKKRAREK